MGSIRNYALRHAIVTYLLAGFVKAWLALKVHLVDSHGQILLIKTVPFSIQNHASKKVNILTILNLCLLYLQP
jgi:hypothetical protein